MSEEIRHLTLEESTPILHFLDNYAFFPSPPLPEFEEYARKIRQQKGAEFYAVFTDDGPQTVASLRDLTQNVRGKLFRMVGIADVASHPAGRRKGYVRAILRHLFEVSRDEGYPVSCLYPFKESFYERFGYVTFPQVRKILFDPEALAPVLKMDHKGCVELVKFEDGYAEYREYLEGLQQITHGFARFSLPSPEMAKERETWLALARLQDKLVGLMQYNLKEKLMQQHLYAHDFLFSNAQGKFLLLDWIARHINQVSRAELVLHPSTRGELFFTDLRPEQKGLFVSPMGRVIDVERLEGLPVGPGEITIQVSDADGEWNNDIWRFAGEKDGLAIEKSANPDCHLTIQGLSALVYGVYSPDELNLRGWGNPDKQTQTILQQMFPHAVPFLHAMY
jgi:predicted acetyltransferase